jgi:hypothetical protein
MSPDKGTDMAKKNQPATEESSEKPTAQDEQSQPAKNANKVKGLWAKIRAKIRSNKKLSATIAASALLIIAIVALTDARFILMNLFTSAKVEVSVIDSKTGQPVPQATVELGGKTGESNDQGVAQLSDVDFGNSTLKVTKLAYENYEQSVKIKHRKQSVQASLVPTGTPISFTVTDLISGEAVKGAKASFQESDALGDEKGQVVLSVPPQLTSTVTVNIAAEGYLSKDFEVTTEAGKVNEAALTPAGKDYFFSKRSGELHLYASNLDGTGQEVVLKATGRERDQAEYVVSPDGSHVAFVSTREGNRKENGDLREELFLFSTSDRKLKKIDTGNVDFTIIGWYEGRVYYQVYGDNYDANDNNKLKFYGVSGAGLKTLLVARGIGQVIFVSDRIAAAVYTSARDQFVTIKLDGSDKQTLLEEESIYGLSQQSPDKLVFAVFRDGGNKWYEYTGTNGKLTKLPGEPAQLYYRQFVESPDEKHTAWIERRDGQDLVVLGDENGKETRVVTEKRGAAYPLRWINDRYLIFRVTSGETADYIVAISGGSPRKIANVHTSSYYRYED